MFSISESFMLFGLDGRESESRDSGIRADFEAAVVANDDFGFDALNGRAHAAAINGDLAFVAVDTLHRAHQTVVLANKLGDEGILRFFVQF